MTITIKYFGLTADLFGKQKETLTFETVVSITDLKELLISKNIKLNQIDYKLALNQEIVSDERRILSDKDEIALLPAYAGG